MFFPVELEQILIWHIRSWQRSRFSSIIARYNFSGEQDREKQKHDRGFDFVNIDMDRWREELYEARVILWENTAMYDNRSKPEKEKELDNCIAPAIGSYRFSVRRKRAHEACPTRAEIML